MSRLPAPTGWRDFFINIWNMERIRDFLSLLSVPELHCHADIRNLKTTLNSTPTITYEINPHMKDAAPIKSLFTISYLHKIFVTMFLEVETLYIMQSEKKQEI